MHTRRTGSWYLYVCRSLQGLAIFCRGDCFTISEGGGDFVCQAWQRAGEVATISGQKRGRCPQMPQLEANLSKDTPGTLRISTDMSQVGLNPGPKVHIMGTPTWRVPEPSPEATHGILSISPAKMGKKAGRKAWARSQEAWV